MSSQTDPNVSKHSALKAQNNIAQGKRSGALGNANQGKRRPVRATDNLIIFNDNLSFAPLGRTFIGGNRFPRRSLGLWASAPSGRFRFQFGCVWLEIIILGCEKKSARIG